MSMMDEAGPPQAAPQGGDQFASGVRDLLEQARALARLADTDQEAVQIEQITSLLAKLLAQGEKDHMDALQGKASPAMLMKMLGGR